MPPADPVPALPSRIAWFAPWRWFPRLNPWQRWTVLVSVLFVAYVLSPVPVSLLLELSGWLPTAEPVLHVVYFPVQIAFEQFDAAKWFYKHQRDLIEAVIRRMVNP